MKAWRGIAAGAVALIGMSLLVGCEDKAAAPQSGSSPGLVSSTSGVVSSKPGEGLQETKVGPTEASRSDIKTLRDQAVQDRHTLDDANRAVGVLGR